MTKRIWQLALLAAGITLLTSCAEDAKVMLFNGSNLDNWNVVLFDSTAVLDEVFRVEDGVIKVLGKPNGYLVTRDSYSNYKLHVEWRWAAEPTNSGVLLHVQEKNLVEWPFCIEAQLKHTQAGDFVLMGNGSGITVGDTTLFIQPSERRYKVSEKLEESSEYEPGEWNSYDITCSGDTIELSVNGVLQNAGTAATITSGQIALQSEGSSMEFRNVYLVPMEE